jgi:hypothetical protein
MCRRGEKRWVLIVFGEEALDLSAHTRVPAMLVQE